MDSLFALTRRISPILLRISLGLILVWIGALKFVDPSPVVGLLQASFSFLASNAIVYPLGVVEVVLGIMLFAGIGVRYVGLILVGLFAGTLAIFLIAPKVTYGDAGFPFLSLPGEFLLKDLVLMAASIAMAAMETERSAEAMAADRIRSAA
jgi:reactive chlorine resistance protein C